ncbi:MAG: HD domain-containing protein [Bacteroidales bacterium]|nr:HD domain-containing protein [Bacteroidales bacterium]
MIKNRIADEILQARTLPRKEDMRGCYYRDQTAILHSKPFRRLKHKTQVFFNPDDDHICTRIEHVLHVATVSATICRGLNSKKEAGWQLNEDLAYAISLGHDLGHTPFGHAGEAALSRYLGGHGKFIHEVNSYRVVEKLVERGHGLNLTYAVKDGIICHNGEKFEQSIKPDFTVKDLDAIDSRRHLPSTYEGAIVRFSDKIAYLGRDIEDAMVAGFIDKKDIPLNIRKKIGESNSDIINYLVNDLVAHSSEEAIAVSEEAHELMLELRKFNYKHIYGHPQQLEIERSCEKIIATLFEYLFEIQNRFNWETARYRGTPKLVIDNYFVDYLKTMRPFYLKEAAEKSYNSEEMGKQIVADYLSGMTDRFTLECMHEISLPPAIKFRLGKGTF